jgi:hypothetical protein
MVRTVSGVPTLKYSQKLNSTPRVFAALAAGAAAAWGAAVIGGRHRDENIAPLMRFSWGRQSRSTAKGHVAVRMLAKLQPRLPA